MGRVAQATSAARVVIRIGILRRGGLTVPRPCHVRGNAKTGGCGTPVRRTSLFELADPLHGVGELFRVGVPEACELRRRRGTARACRRSPRALTNFGSAAATRAPRRAVFASTGFRRAGGREQRRPLEEHGVEARLPRASQRRAARPAACRPTTRGRAPCRPSRAGITVDGPVASASTVAAEQRRPPPARRRCTARAAA